MSDVIWSTDSYKLSQFKQYPKNTVRVSSYIESRGGDYDSTLFFGLQMFLPKLKAPTRKQVNRRAMLAQAHGVSFNRQGWLDIADLGYLPLRIQAVKEGTILPTKNVLVQVINTDDRFPWLTSYIETALLRAVWYPTTVATRSRKIKNILKGYLEQSATDLAGLDFMLHDFGARGVSSQESAGIGAVAHLVNFRGTDTLTALDVAADYYSESMAGFSVDAMEHSTVTSWGREHEADSYENMIDLSSRPGSIYSIVSDSYDIYKAVDEIFGVKLKVKIETLGGRLVVRPDSGDPTKVVPRILSILEKRFGASVNSKGFKVLPSYLRVLQGDGIDEHSIILICEEVMQAGYSIENLVFGMGGQLLQGLNRDTMKFAMKASAIKSANGFWSDVKKDPVTDPGKQSKAGRLALIHSISDGWRTIRETELGENTNMLEDVFVDGKIVRDQRLSDIRALADA